MAKVGISKAAAPFFLPAYEWYNDSITTWTAEAGLQLVNFTPGTRSNADYTYPSMGKQYRSSIVIYKSILAYEADRPAGLNGFLLLMHIGTDPRRTDKLYQQLPELINTLKKRGYHFNSINTVLQ